MLLPIFELLFNPLHLVGYLLQILRVVRDGAKFSHEACDVHFVHERAKNVFKQTVRNRANSFLEYGRSLCAVYVKAENLIGV